MKYESPEIKVIVFTANDIITASDPNELEGDVISL